MRIFFTFAVLGILLLVHSKAQCAETKFEGFVDTYFAFDFNKPISPDRPYATQAVRDNEFNLNLAFIEAKIEKEKVHGRFALQTGTSVQANYSGEPTQGTNSGPLATRNIQEAYLGYQLSENLWFDAGIYASHIGFESFVSRDNWTYTRSLSAEFTPYYQSGVRMTYLFSKQLAVQLHVVNGWSAISETNKDKSVGLQLAYSPSDVWVFTYNNYFGNDTGEKMFHQLITKFVANQNWQLALSLDYGQQRSLQTTDWFFWQVQTLLVKYQISTRVSMNARVEHMADKNYALATLPNFVSPSSNGFNIWGQSIGVDVILDPSLLLWRTEIKAFSSPDPAFQTSSGTSNTNALAVTSLALTF